MEYQLLQIKDSPALSCFHGLITVLDWDLDDFDVEQAKSYHAWRILEDIYVISVGTLLIYLTEIIHRTI